MPILSDTNCSPTLVKLISLESSIASRTDTLSAELCTKTYSSNWPGFSLTEVGSVFAWVAKTFELSVFPKEDISWTAAVLVSVTLWWLFLWWVLLRSFHSAAFTFFSCILAQFTHLLEFIWPTDSTGYRFYCWKFLKQFLQHIIPYNWPFIGLQFGVRFTNLHAVTPFKWPFRTKLVVQLDG